MADDPVPTFDMGGFVERYVAGSVAGAKAAATIQAAELGHAFSTLQIQMDIGFTGLNQRLDCMDKRFESMEKRFERIEGILARAFPENGHKPPEQGSQ